MVVVSGLARVAALVRLARPRTALPGVLAALTGAEVQGGAVEPAPLAAAVGVALLVATATNLHNATTDVVEDSLNQPARVAVLRRAGGAAGLVAAAGFVACAGTIAGLGPVGGALAVVAGVGMHQYSGWPLRLKGRPLLGTLTFAGSLVVPAWVGMIAAGPGWGDPWARPTAADVLRVASWTLALGAAWVAKAYVKNLPDREGDAAAGLWTTATTTADRARRDATFAACYGPAFLVVPFAAGAAGPAVPHGWPLWLAAVYLLAAWSGRTVARAATPAAANEALARDMGVSTVVLATVYTLVGGSAPLALGIAALGFALRHPAFDARLGAADMSTMSCTPAGDRDHAS